MSESKQIGILLIATRKYKQFVPQLLESLSINFMTEHNLQVNLFTDAPDQFLRVPFTSGRLIVKTHLIEPLGWPEATLNRYEIFTSTIYPDCDYLYYLDVDMTVKSPVPYFQPIGLLAVRHPGYFISKGGAWCDNMASTAYVYPENRIMYYAGGFQGGRTDDFYNAMECMKNNIKRDKHKDVMAEWHDESHWNKFLSDYKGSLIVLAPSYCLVEQEDLRKAWGIDKYPPIIVALAKDHKKMREQE